MTTHLLASPPSTAVYGRIPTQMLSTRLSSTMYTHILVPLDGSDVAEQVLPHVLELAKRLGARVTLLRATLALETLIAETLQNCAKTRIAGVASVPL